MRKSQNFWSELEYFPKNKDKQLVGLVDKHNDKWDKNNGSMRIYSFNLFFWYIDFNSYD